MVREPECEGASGRLLSPSANRTRLIGIPKASAATWVIDVYVPGPMSLVPDADVGGAVRVDPGQHGAWAPGRVVNGGGHADADQLIAVAGFPWGGVSPRPAKCVRALTKTVDQTPGGEG